MSVSMHECTCFLKCDNGWAVSLVCKVITCTNPNSLASPTLVRVSLDCHFMSMNDRNGHQTLQVLVQHKSFLYSIQNLSYMVVESSLSWKACKKFSWMAIYGSWIVSILKTCNKVVPRVHNRLYWMTIAITAVWSSVAWNLYNITYFYQVAR